MIPRLSPGRRAPVVAALGSSLTVSWASSYYIPAVLAVPMAEDLGLSPVWVFGAFSMAMVVSAMVGPWAGARIDGFGGRGVLMASNIVFAAGLALLAAAPSPVVLFAGWAVIGLGMGIGLYEAVARYERRLIEAALQSTGGVQKRAADLLKLKPTTLNEKIKRLGIRD